MMIFKDFQRIFKEKRKLFLQKEGSSKLILDDVSKVIYEAAKSTYTPELIKSANKRAFLWLPNRKGTLEKAGDKWKMFANEIPEILQKKKN